MRPIFKTKMLIYQSKANLDEKILFGQIIHQFDPEIRKMLVKRNFLKHGFLIPFWSIINLLLKFKFYF